LIGWVDGRTRLDVESAPPDAAAVDAVVPGVAVFSRATRERGSRALATEVLLVDAAVLNADIAASTIEVSLATGDRIWALNAGQERYRDRRNRPGRAATVNTDGGGRRRLTRLGFGRGTLDSVRSASGTGLTGIAED